MSTTTIGKAVQRKTKHIYVGNWFFRALIVVIAMLHVLNHLSIPVDWLATIGTVLYIASMWVNGITEGLMWRSINDDSTLIYSFVEALQASHPEFVVCFAGGVLFLTGMLVMAYNSWRTVQIADAALAAREAKIA